MTILKLALNIKSMKQENRNFWKKYENILRGKPSPEKSTKSISEKF